MIVGLSEADLHTISIADNPAMINGLSDDSSQSSSAPMTGLVQPQQAHWPHHPTPSTNPHHLKNYILDGDDDFDDFDYDDYGGRSDARAGSSSPLSASGSRPKRPSSSKRTSQTGSKKTNGKDLFFFLDQSIKILFLFRINYNEWQYSIERESSPTIFSC